MEKTYGLIGYPLSHSFSRKYFTDKFLQEGIAERYSYKNFEIRDLSALPGLLNANPSLSGLNVTIPYKEKVIAFLDVLEESARQIHAVNTIQILREASGKVVRTTGYNTDLTGFYNTIKPLLQPHHTGALVLGSGGASKAVLYALRLLNIPYQLVSRKELPGAISYSEVTRALLNRFPVIINTTPLGTFPDVTSFPEIPYEYLGPLNLLYDLVYNPPETQFLLKGRRQGAQTVNGYAMLVSQAEASWQIWQAAE